MQIRNNYLTGVVLCLIATVSWGAMFPIMTHALLKMDPFTFTAVRFTLICILLMIFFLAKEGWSALRLDGNAWLLWLLGSIGFAGFGFMVFLGQQLAGPDGALSASIMLATMPLLGLLINWALVGVRPPLYSLAFFLLSFLGVLLVITKGSTAVLEVLQAHYLANFFMIAGPVCWVIYTLGSGYFPQWSPIKYTALSTLFGLPTIYAGTFILIWCGQIHLPTLHMVMMTLPELLYMSLIAGFVGFLCWNYGNKMITPINGILFMVMVPVTAFIVSTAEGVVPTFAQVLGVLFTAAALILNNVYQRGT